MPFYDRMAYTFPIIEAKSLDSDVKDEKTIMVEALVFVPRPEGHFGVDTMMISVEDDYGCKAIACTTGERCKNLANRDGMYCRYHVDPRKRGIRRIKGYNTIMTKSRIQSSVTYMMGMLPGSERQLRWFIRLRTEANTFFDQNPDEKEFKINFQRLTRKLHEV